MAGMILQIRRPPHIAAGNGMAWSIGGKGHSRDTHTVRSNSASSTLTSPSCNTVAVIASISVFIAAGDIRTRVSRQRSKSDTLAPLSVSSEAATAHCPKRSMPALKASRRV